MLEGCEGAGLGWEAGLEQPTKADARPRARTRDRRTSDSKRFMVPLQRIDAYRKKKQSFATIHHLRRLRCAYRISARECSSAPRFGVGIAPTSLATQAPTRLATSFIRSRDAPWRYSCTKPAVKASPDPTVSATRTLNPGCALVSPLRTSRLPRPPRVIQNTFNS